MVIKVYIEYAMFINKNWKKYLFSSYMKQSNIVDKGYNLLKNSKEKTL